MKNSFDQKDNQLAQQNEGIELTISVRTRTHSPKHRFFGL